MVIDSMFVYHFVDHTCTEGWKKLHAELVYFLINGQIIFLNQIGGKNNNNFD